MVLDKTTPPTEKTPTKRVDIHNSHPSSDEKTKGNRTSKSHQMAKSSLHSTKEGLGRRQIDIGPLYNQQLYKMPKIQDVNTQRSEVTPSQVLLDNISRHERRILARPNLPVKTPLSRLPLQKQKLAISSNAIRPMHSSPHLYQTYVPCDQSYGRGRNLVPPLFRRPVNYSFIKGGMPKKNKISSRDSKKTRIDNKFKKVPSRTSSSLRMAGSAIQLKESLSKSEPRKEHVSSKKSQRSNRAEMVYQTLNNEASRSSKLGRSMRSFHKTNDDLHKKDSEVLQKTKSGCSYTDQQRVKIKPLQMVNHGIHSSMPGKSSTRYFNPDRCFSKRLGLSDRSKAICRTLRPFNVLFNKRPGTNHHMVCSSHGDRRKQNNPSLMRQLYSSGSTQKRLLNKFSSGLNYRNDLEKSFKSKLESLFLSHKRKLQCGSRPTLQELSNFHRMVNISQRFQKDSQIEPTTGSGSFRNLPEPQIEEIRFPMPKRKGSSSGCSINPLGRMGSSLSVSPLEYDFEGFSENETFRVCKRNFSDTRDSNQTLVHGLEASQSTFFFDQSSPSTSSGRQVRDQSSFYNSSRLEVIEEAYQEKFPNCNRAVSLMSKPLRYSSTKDYQHKWEVFCTFLKERNIPPNELSFRNVLNFFTYLFYEKNLKAASVAHYRSALSVPLLVRFNMDLRVPEVSFLLRSMAIQRPNVPFSAPAWSLNKVLSYLDNLTLPLSDIMLFRKTAFLLLLATGWRISELHACVRNTEYCQILQNSLRIRPHPSFLAKNESTTRRWKHKEIKKLLLPDKTISKLCPVSSLIEYLQRTSQTSKKELFVPLLENQSPFTVHQLSTQICKLILAADPNTKANVHDVRKYAASCSLAETMLVGDLVSALNWSSSTTFFKFYMAPTEPIRFPVSLPVNDPSDHNLGANPSQ